MGHLKEKRIGSPEPWIEIENCDEQAQSSMEVLLEREPGRQSNPIQRDQARDLNDFASRLLVDK